MKLFDKILNKEEHAKVIDWSPKWDSGAPLPQVFSNGRKTFLTYLISQSSSNFDGTIPTEIDNTKDFKYDLALVEFAGSTFKFGIANDEVHHGLALWNKGMEHYSAHLIENSKWIQELNQINSVHPNYNPKSKDSSKHYVLLFHDELLEIIANGFRIETFKMTFKELAYEVANRMNS